MVFFNSRDPSETPYSPPNPEDDPDHGKFERSRRTVLERCYDGLTNAFFVIAGPTVLTGAILRFLGSRVDKATGQSILLLVLGLGCAFWAGMMFKRVRPHDYLPPLDFTERPKDF